MTDAYFYARYQSQEGWAQTGVQTYHANYFGQDGIDPNRQFITRFSDVSIPLGATITSASVIYSINAKVSTDNPQSFTYNHYFEATTAGGTTLRQDAAALREGDTEESGSNRNWKSHLSSQTFTWTPGPTGTLNNCTVSVTTLIQQAINTNSGKHMALLFKLEVLTEVGDLSVGTHAIARPVALLIQYTGGTAANEVVLVNENPNFTIPALSSRPNLYNNNSFFGLYSNIPTYSQITNDGAIVAPQGGNIVKITATEDKACGIFSEPLARGSAGPLVPGEWMYFSAYVYMPVGGPDVSLHYGPDMPLDVPQANARTILKGQWVRLFGTLMYSWDFGQWLGVTTEDKLTSGSFFYVANFNLTRGLGLYPYFDGDTTDTATYHRTFDWGGGASGKRSGGTGYVALDSAPTATTTSPQPSGAIYNTLYPSWAYSDTYSEAESRVRVEVRKKRVP